MDAMVFVLPLLAYNFFTSFRGSQISQPVMPSWPSTGRGTSAIHHEFGVTFVTAGATIATVRIRFANKKECGEDQTLWDFARLECLVSSDWQGPAGKFEISTGCSLRNPNKRWNCRREADQRTQSRPVA
jgi:hypothetical protein